MKLQKSNNILKLWMTSLCAFVFIRFVCFRSNTSEYVDIYTFFLFPFINDIYRLSNNKHLYLSCFKPVRQTSKKNHHLKEHVIKTTIYDIYQSSENIASWILIISVNSWEDLENPEILSRKCKNLNICLLSLIWNTIKPNRMVVVKNKFF